MANEVSIIYGKDGKEKHRFEDCALSLNSSGLYAHNDSEKLIVYKLKKGECIVVEKTKKQK